MVDLIVVQSVSVEFGDMAADVPEEAVVPFQDLRTESRYVDLRPSLECAGLNAEESHIEIRTLDAQTTAIPLNFRLEVSPADAEQWGLLAELDSDVAAGEIIPLTDLDFTVMQEGLDAVSDIAMGSEPVYDVLVTGESPDDVGDLTVDLFIQLDFSSDPLGCP